MSRRDSPFSPDGPVVRPTDIVDSDPGKREVTVEIVASAKAGDPAALEAVLMAYRGYAARFLYRLVGPTSDFDDLHQTVLITIVQQLPRLRGFGALKSWIGSICVNVYRDYFRTRASRVKLVEEAQHIGTVLGEASHATPHADLEAAEELALLERALESLSVVQRQAVLLAMRGHSIDEIAEIMGAGRSATKLRLYYGRKKIAKALARQSERAQP